MRAPARWLCVRGNAGGCDPLTPRVLVLSGVLPLLPRCSLPPPQRRTARSRSGVSVVSRGDVLRASGSAVMESAAAPTFVTASELSRIKQSTAIRTAEDIKREKAEAAARMEKRQAVSKARKVGATAAVGRVLCSARARGSTVPDTNGGAAARHA